MWYFPENRIFNFAGEPNIDGDEDTKGALADAEIEISDVSSVGTYRHISWRNSTHFATPKSTRFSGPIFPEFPLKMPEIVRAKCVDFGVEKCVAKCVDL